MHTLISSWKMWTFFNKIFWWGKFTVQFRGFYDNFKRNAAISGCYYKKPFIDLDLFGKNANNFKCHRPVLT